VAQHLVDDLQAVGTQAGVGEQRSHSERDLLHPLTSTVRSDHFRGRNVMRR
jgi:hypothetical protein